MNELFEQSVREFFSKNPEITSFGWYQWHTGEMLKDKDEVYTTIDKADINGNLGEYLWDPVNTKRQELVHQFLKQFDPNLMRVAFGDNAGIFVYPDSPIEIEPYDPYNQALPYEL